MKQLFISINSALSRNPIQFRKQEVDPYQQSFLRHTSYLHEYINDEDVSEHLMFHFPLVLPSNPIHLSSILFNLSV